MSHEATNWAFQQKGLKPATRIVLLMLADRHNPDHGCFPSKKRLSADCEMSERSVFNHIKILEDAGLVRVITGGMSDEGSFTSNRYLLGFEPEFTTTDSEPQAKFAYGKNCPRPQAKFADDRRQNLPNNPVIEPSKSNPVSKRDEANAIFNAVYSAAKDAEAVDSFIAYRKRRKKDLTLTAARRLASSLQEIQLSGFDPADALGMAEERGWVTINLEWIRNATRGQNDNRSNSHDTSNADTADRIRAVAAAARRPSSDDCFRG